MAGEENHQLEVACLLSPITVDRSVLHDIMALDYVKFPEKYRMNGNL